MPSKDIDEQPPDGRDSDDLLVRRGKEPPKSEIRRLKSCVKKNPDDICSRLLLLGALDKSSPEYLEQLIWLIDNRPGSTAHSIIRIPAPSSVHILKKRWANQMKLHESDWRVFYNAYCQLMFWDTELSVEALEQANRIDPNNEKILDELAETYVSMALESDEYPERNSKSLIQNAVACRRAAVACLEQSAPIINTYWAYARRCVGLANLAIRNQLFEEAKVLGDILYHQRISKLTLSSTRDSDSMELCTDFVSGFAGCEILCCCALANNNVNDAANYLKQLSKLCERDEIDKWKLVEKMPKLESVLGQCTSILQVARLLVGEMSQSRESKRIIAFNSQLTAIIESLDGVKKMTESNFH